MTNPVPPAAGAGMPEPKPCPWCGKTPRAFACSSTSALYSVACNNYDCPSRPSVYSADTQERAIGVWNTRASSPSGARTPEDFDLAQVAIDDRRAIEQIATEVIAVGIETPDGTALGAVRALIAAYKAAAHPVSGDGTREVEPALRVADEAMPADALNHVFCACGKNEHTCQVAGEHSARQSRALRVLAVEVRRLRALSPAEPRTDEARDAERWRKFRPALVVDGDYHDGSDGEDGSPYVEWIRMDINVVAKLFQKAGTGNTVESLIDGSVASAPREGTRDTERLDWLDKQQAVSVDYWDGSKQWVVKNQRGPWHTAYQIREAIDAAMSPAASSEGET